MQHRVFVYGTLLRGEVNHDLLGGAALLGPHRTEPRFTLLLLGAYPGLIGGGRTAVYGEVYRIDEAGLLRLDQLEDYPRLYDRCQIPTAFGRAWVYLYRGRIRNRPAIHSGDWRLHASNGNPIRSAAVRGWRDRKNPGKQRTITRYGESPAAKPSG
jgi:gamma-glutamylaminecyclotransferase